MVRTNEADRLRALISADSPESINTAGPSGFRDLPESGNEPLSQPEILFMDPVNEGLDGVEDGPELAPMISPRGMAAVEAALKLEDFPIEKSNIDYTVGDVEVEDGQGGWVEVNVLTDLLVHDQYATLADAIGALTAARDGRLRRGRVA